MSEARYLVADVFDGLATLPDDSVDLVLTSPPFLALRSYLPADHPDKAKEIGSEATPGAFLDVLLDVVVELRRVLAPHGSLCVELGDTYSGSNQVEGRGKFWNAYNCDQDDNTSAPGRSTGGDGWPLAKSLCMVPQSFAWALAYGRNPWTGRELEPWRVRNIIRWCRPNPPVGALGDKFRPATSEMVVACTGGSRYFDLDAVREPHDERYQQRRYTVQEERRGVDGKRTGKTMRGIISDGDGLAPQGNPAGAPPLDYWVIPTHPYPGSHYATWPPDLCIRPIKAMCPERVCRVCGQPSERITEATHDVERSREIRARRLAGETGKGVNGDRGDGGASGFPATENVTLGWSDCGHDDYRRGVILDPFAGSGTTLEVATGHGRDAIGIDLDPRNADLAQQRCGMFLTVEHPAQPAPGVAQSTTA